MEHHAHVGDLIWSLSYIKHHNNKSCVLLNCNVILFEKVKCLLMTQSYIENVEKFANQPFDVDLDLAIRKEQHTSLLDVYYMISNDKPDQSAWLTCDVTDCIPSDKPNIIYRNTNYRNRLFDWKYFIERENINLDKCCFIGSEHEYIQFLMEIKKPRSALHWHKTDTLIDLLQTLNSADHLYCSAGLPLVIALGLGKCMTIENGARYNNIKLDKREYTQLPINMHNVISRDNCIYYEQYNRNTIETV